MATSTHGTPFEKVDERLLESDLEYRYAYFTKFIGFTTDDVAAIHATTARLLPLIPSLVDATYDKMLAYDATRRHFVPRQEGYEGPLPTDAASLSQDDPQIQFRKEHLRRYLINIVANPYDARMVRYLNTVGKIHTPKAGNKRIDVPLVQVNALMGLLAHELLQTILGFGLERGQETRTLLAFNKLLWLQNDLMNRHYNDLSGRS